jgi:hypothetical protein
MCFIDVFWWIEPALRHDGQYVFWLLDLSAVVGIGGLWFAFFLYQLQQSPGGTLLPTHEKAALEAHHG